jgi:diacylglycerol kinase (ATP)
MAKMFDPKTKKVGIAHLAAATGYSLGGLKKLLQEAAFRHEVGIAGVVLVIYFLVGVSAFNIVIALMLMLITFAIEAINTAIELIIDKTSPEISEYAKTAKDLGSFAVMCLLFANGIFAIYVLAVTLL